MKKLLKLEMCEIQASFGWKSFVDGVCVGGLAYIPPYGSVACAGWGLYRAITALD